MTWIGQTFSVGQILTAAQMNNLQADIGAALNQDSGAPVPGSNFITLATQITDGVVGQSEVGASAIGQGELKSALQQTSSVASSVSILFTGGIYTLGWGVGGNSNNTIKGYPSTDYTSGITIVNGSAPATMYFQANYIQASPPYDLGYGNVPLFIFALIDNATGDVIAIDTAPDAPWHYNGPTDVKSKFSREGKSFRACKPVELELANLDIALLTDDERRDIVHKLKTEDKTSLLEITQDIKNADIDLVPHPFVGNDLTGKTVVLLDPCCDLCEELFLFRELGENINDRFMDNKFIIDSAPLDVKSPKGVLTLPFRHKRTK